MSDVKRENGRFVKGTAKPANSGKKKGTPNAKLPKNASLRDALAFKNVSIELALAKAVKESDLAMIRALVQILPYIAPKIDPIPPPDPADPDDQLTASDTSALIDLLSKK